LILIEQQKIPEDYVKPVVEQDLNSRLASMKEQILSRSRVEPIIEKFNLFADGKASMDDRVNMMAAGNRDQIDSLRPIGWNARFYITFTAQDPHVAQEVAGRSCHYSSARIKVRARHLQKARPTF